MQSGLAPSSASYAWVLWRQTHHFNFVNKQCKREKFKNHTHHYVTYSPRAPPPPGTFKATFLATFAVVQHEIGHHFQLKQCVFKIFWCCQWTAMTPPTVLNYSPPTQFQILGASHSLVLPPMENPNLKNSFGVGHVAQGTALAWHLAKPQHSFLALHSNENEMIKGSLRDYHLCITF